MRLPLAALVVAATFVSLTSCAPSSPRECTPDEVAAVFGGIFSASDVQSLGAFELPDALVDTTCAAQYQLPLVQSDEVVFGGGAYSIAVVGGGDAFYDTLGATLTDDGFTASTDQGGFSRWSKGQLELTALDLADALTNGTPDSLGDTADLRLIVVTTLTTAD